MVPSPNSTIVLSGGHKDSVRTVAWNITGTRLASGSSDKTIRVWNPEKPAARYSIELKGHSQPVDQLCWDPTNPDQLASASLDKTVRFWDYRGIGKEEIANSQRRSVSERSILKGKTSTSLGVPTEHMLPWRARCCCSHYADSRMILSQSSTPGNTK